MLRLTPFGFMQISLTPVPNNNVTFNEHHRAPCPACQSQKGSNYQKLNLSLHESGAYHCFRGCTPEEIREALGTTKNQQIPAALTKPPRSCTIAPQKVKEAHERLLAHAEARAWLHQRGITDALIARHQLGLVRAKAGDRHLPAISIPIANADGTAYYQKKRLASWSSEAAQLSGYQPWSQAGIPAQVWFTYLPAEATATWLCEGEWDAIVLGWQVRQAELPIAVATFTTGCQTIPPDEQLALLPGSVIVFYDRNDQPLKNGDRPGEVGARKVAKRLGDRCKIALVPMPNDCQVKGWDVIQQPQFNQYLGVVLLVCQETTLPVGMLCSAYAHSIKLFPGRKKWENNARNRT